MNTFPDRGQEAELGEDWNRTNPTCFQMDRQFTKPMTPNIELAAKALTLEIIREYGNGFLTSPKIYPVALRHLTTHTQSLEEENKRLREALLLFTPALEQIRDAKGSEIYDSWCIADQVLQQAKDPFDAICEDGHKLAIAAEDARKVRGNKTTPVPYYYPLFEHMDKEHGLTLLDSELEEIVHVVKLLEGRYQKALTKPT